MSGHRPDPAAVWRTDLIGHGQQALVVNLPEEVPLPTAQILGALAEQFLDPGDVGLAVLRVSQGYPEAGRVPVEISFDTYRKWGPPKKSVVRLTARTADGREVQGYGVGEGSFSSAHLVWQIPAGILTFPWGIYWIIGTSNAAFHTGATERR